MILRVIKIGTSLLRGIKDKSTNEMIAGYSKYLSASLKRNDKVVLVTSGAVGLGCNRLGIRQRPKDLLSLQATAAIGQGQLMALYESAMRKHGHAVAQVLLTRSDLGSRKNFQGASNTLRKLIEWGVMPVVNENDTLSPEELRFGDNDTLSALVATAINADELILLTDVDQLYSADPRQDSEAKPISDIHHQNAINKLESSKAESGSWGTGGMTTKLAAARIATASGITVHLADGRDPKRLDELLRGSRGGTVFHPSPNPIGNRKSWLLHALQPKGVIELDSGASNALKNCGASLLLVGITGINGCFETNQPVRIVNQEGEEIGRGLSSFSSNELLQAITSKKDLRRSPVVIHRDVLALSNAPLE